MNYTVRRGLCLRFTEEEYALAVSEVGPLVLVVDDDANILHLVETCLDREDIASRTSDGQAALRCYEESLPAVVLLDLRLDNGIFGGDIASNLKKYENPPAIILMSGQAEFQRTAGRIGADGFLMKPFDTSELVMMVRGLLRKHQRAV